MTEALHPTAAALLASGLALAEAGTLSSLSVDDVVRGANVAKGTFYVHFPDRASFLVALHDRFHDDLRERIRQASRGLEPGAERLERSVTAYLDGCLEARGVKSMLAGARGEPAVADRVTAANDRFARSAVDDMAALGREHPLESARLFVAMVAEIALLELDRHRRDNRLRHALWEYIA
ncbi:MAG: TetR/AcrR family transcriptional regulator [Acidimicrobiales bacterium]